MDPPRPEGLSSDGPHSAANVDKPPHVDPTRGSPLSPFRHSAFTVIWSASLASNLGSWIYTAASGWLMTGLNPDPLIVSLVQVAASLPIFLVAIPAGALADIVDRRRFLIGGEIANTALAAIFAGLFALGLVGPWMLLIFTFLIGAFGALTAPAWQAVTPQLVPKRDLSAAIAACCGATIVGARSGWRPLTRLRSSSGSAASRRRICSHVAGTSTPILSRTSCG